MAREILVDITRRALQQRLHSVAVDTRHGYSTTICDTVASRYSQISTSKGQLSTGRSSNDSRSYGTPSRIFQSSRTTPKKPLVAKLRPDDRPLMKPTSTKEAIEEILKKWNVGKSRK